MYYCVDTATISYTHAYTCTSIQRVHVMTASCMVFPTLGRASGGDGVPHPCTAGGATPPYILQPAPQS